MLVCCTSNPAQHFREWGLSYSNCRGLGRGMRAALRQSVRAPKGRIQDLASSASQAVQGPAVAAALPASSVASLPGPLRRSFSTSLQDLVAAITWTCICMIHVAIIGRLGLKALPPTRAKVCRECFLQGRTEQVEVYNVGAWNCLGLQGGQQQQEQQPGAEAEPKRHSGGVGPFGAPLQQVPQRDIQAPLGEALGNGTGWRKSSWRSS